MKRNIYKKRLMKNTTSVMSILVAVILIFTSATAVNSNNEQEEMNIDMEEEYTLLSTGLLSRAMPAVHSTKELFPQNGRGAIIYAADASNDDFVWFDTDTPTTYNVIAPSGFTNFPQGGCFVEDIWWVCDTTGLVYTVDETSGDMTYVGNAGTGGLSGLAYDPSSGILYGSSTTNLYTIDQGTGAATLIGPFNTLGWMISIVCDGSGDMYGFDLELANSPFYSIDTSSGAATLIGYMGIATNWGQDLAYDIDNDVLYLCAIRYSGGVGYAELYTIDTSSGVATYLGDLAAGAQTTCAAIQYTTGPPPGHDVALVSINSPEDGPAGVITPEVTVKNKGNNTETNVPVDMEIYKILPSTTVFSEGFEDAIPGYLIFPPLGWSIESTSTSTWYKYSTGYARCWESGATGAQDEWLITETFDCSALTTVGISMWQYFGTPSGGDDRCEILGSTDDGVSWPNMIVNLTAYQSGAIRSYDISSWAAGESEVKIAWRYVSGPATGSHYTYFRQFKIGSPISVISGLNEDFEGTWGPYGNNPPAGWTILDFGDESPPVWNNNDWNNYYYSTFGSNTARAYYYPIENQDEHLITPMIDCSLITDTTLRFRQYFYYYSASSHGYVEGSIDNGTTWPYSIAHYTSTQATNYYTYDISSWADGESEVKIRFRYVDYNGLYWYVDDVMCGDIVDEVVLFENFWFIDWMPTDWGPNGWMEEEVTGTTDYDPNVWRAADSTYLTNPSVDPYAGDYMAIYDTGLLFPNGASCRLYTPAMDWSAYGATVLTLKFMIYISNYMSSYTDRCDVQVSPDGSTWNTLESINTYDSSNPGWVEKVIDLSSYASETTARLGFLAVDGGYRDIIIDEVSIVASPTLLEYDETAVITSIAPDESIDVEFDDWTPDDWQISENVDISYTLTATTLLPGDENPNNDDKEGFATLSYPYLHDVGIMSINDPTSGTAQTLPVEVTIKNLGQFTECCYATNVQIGAEDVTVIDYEDFESDDGGYTVIGGGWTWGAPTSGPSSAHSGTKLWGTNNYLTYANYKLTSVPYTLSGATRLRFWHWYDTELNYDGGNVKISTDGGTTWNILGSYLDPYNVAAASTANAGIPGEPCFSGHGQGFWEEVEFDLSGYTGMTVQFRWHFGSDGSVQYPGWFIDDVSLVSVGLTAEYDEDICTIVLDPGEEATLTFPDWTPDALALGVSGSINYIVMAEQQLIGDTNPANDQMLVDITLDYWHDVGVKEITDPSIGRTQEWLYYHDGYDANGIGLTATGLWEGAMRLTPTELGLYDGWELNAVNWYHHETGTQGGSIKIYDAGTTTTPGALIMQESFSVSGSGMKTIDLTTSVIIDASEDLWVSVEIDQLTVPLYPFGVDDGPMVVDKGGFCYIAPTWYQLIDFDLDMNWCLEARIIPGGGPPGADVYIAPGSQSFAAIMENIGVFPETGLDANAKLFAFNETGVPYEIYEANYTDFDLDPLGGEELATFGSYNFVDSGIYELKIFLPLTGDDYPGNNLEKLGIGVDGTAPTSDHTVDPAIPNGENNWYISDVTVSFTADDGTEDWQSGVDHIEYRVDGGNVQTGDSVTLYNDGEYDVEYRAVDNVGNEEAWNPVPTIKIDQTVPKVDLTWESPDNKHVVFTATCSDATSGMDYVEFYLNDAWMFTAPAAPFVWTITWSPDLEHAVFKSTAFDFAGNFDFDTVTDIRAIPVPHGTPNPVVRQTNPL